MENIFDNWVKNYQQYNENGNYTGQIVNGELEGFGQ